MSIGPTAITALNPENALQATSHSLVPVATAPPKTSRHELPSERNSITHKFTLAGNEVFLTVGMYPNGAPGEISIVMAKEGSTAAGLLTSFAHAVSISLQHGAPLKLLCEQFRYMRYEPSGWTDNPDIQNAASVTDYVFHWLQRRFLPETISKEPDHHAGLSPANPAADSPTLVSDGPLCKFCGSITQRAGSCYYCRNCGSTTGCG